MIEFKNVKKNYGKHTVIEDMNLVINAGELVTLIGPSGCGKTTTLKMINRLNDATSGDILIDGKSIYDHDPIKLRRSMGYVIQQTGLFPNMTIEQNIGVIPQAEGLSAEEILKRTKSLLEMVGLDYDTYAKRFPDDLSGGQQQRVGIARAFANHADIILMDEPFSALDPITKAQLQDELNKIQKKFKKTIVFVTHDMNEAIKISNRICIMHEGKIVQYDTPEKIMRDPKNDFVSSFIGENRLWDSPELLKAEDIMNNNPITVNKELSLFYAISLFREKKVDHLIVVDDENVYQGTISAANLRKEIEEGAKVMDYVQNTIFTCDVNEPILNLFKHIPEHEVSMIPVLKDGKLQGIITKTSILVTFVNHTLNAGGEE
ncbi:betaine/proline/choline family ABC transporter ATP-binding protein [Mycoplasma sp. P36-A1]|uniref:betaine/proline/choline family ABC transporter ATP-binding protein n=1 Tax=Mycoplasma sp. P36-A1 TaxID=3252900 RepID=UPI003C2FEF75